MDNAPTDGKIVILGNTAINSTGSSLEDVVNRLILYGVARGVMLGELLRLARQMMGGIGTLVIDEDDAGEVNGIILANPAIIEHVADLCAENGWSHTTMHRDSADTIIN